MTVYNRKIGGENVAWIKSVFYWEIIVPLTTKQSDSAFRKYQFFTFSTIQLLKTNFNKNIFLVGQLYVYMGTNRSKREIGCYKVSGFSFTQRSANHSRLFCRFPFWQGTYISCYGRCCPWARYVIWINGERFFFIWSKLVFVIGRLITSKKNYFVCKISNNSLNNYISLLTRVCMGLRWAGFNDLVTVLFFQRHKRVNDRYMSLWYCASLSRRLASVPQSAKLESVVKDCWL